MKLIISLLLFLIISCEQISKDEVINTIENTKDVIVEKTIKSPDTTEKIDLKVEEDKVNKNKIFYLIGEPYYIEGVKYVPEENYSYEEIGLATFYDKELHNKKTINNGKINSARDSPSQVRLRALPLLFSKYLDIVVVAV